MDPNEWANIRIRGKRDKCICDDCEDCFHYRPWPALDLAGNQIGMKMGCSIEVIAVTLRRVVGSIEGLQESSDQTRNRHDSLMGAVARAIGRRKNETINISGVVDPRGLRGDRGSGSGG